MTKNNTFVSILLVAAIVIALLIAFERMRIMPQATERTSVVELLEVVESDSPDSSQVEEAKGMGVLPAEVEGLDDLPTIEIEAVGHVPDKEPYYWKSYASMRQPSVRDPNSEQSQATFRRLKEMRRANLQAEQN